MGNITKQLRFICFYIACFLCIGGIKAQQQLDPKRTNIALPITKTYNDSTKVHLFNLGIFNNINLLKGVQIGVIHADVHQDMKGLNIGGLVSLVRQDAKGMTFGGLLNGVGNLARFECGWTSKGRSIVGNVKHIAQPFAWTSIVCIHQYQLRSRQRSTDFGSC